MSSSNIKLQRTLTCLETPWYQQIYINKIFVDLWKSVAHFFKNKNEKADKVDFKTSLFNLKDNNPYDDWCDNEFFFKIKYSRYQTKKVSVVETYDIGLLDKEKIIVMDLLIN